MGGLGAPAPQIEESGQLDPATERSTGRTAAGSQLGKETTLAMRPEGDQTPEGCCSRANCWIITLCVCNWLATLVFPVIFQDIISGCSFFLLAIAAVCALSGQCCGDKKDCCWRASLAVQGLGLALLVVAMILLSIWTRRVDTIPDPTCELWTGDCLGGGYVSDKYGSSVTECKDPVAWPGGAYTGHYSENGAEHFPAGDGDHGFTSSNGCWEGKYDDECIPLFDGPGDTEKQCERYWKNNQDDIREEWLKWLISMHVIQVVYLFANCAALRGYLARRPAAPSAEAELELAPVALPANHGLKVAQGVFVEGEIIEGEVVRDP